MSSKRDKADKRSASKMLKKAKSFRDDVKGLIRRRPSSSAADQSITEGMTKRSTPKAVKPLGRANSLNEGTKTDKIGEDDVDKLQEEVNKVYRSLKYIQAVVEHEKLQVIPNTATVVLETVMDVFTLISNYFMTNDSTTMLSRHNKVCQCLARFIKWADEILLHGSKVLNKDNAHEVINALSAGVEELKQISVDKLQDRKNAVQPPKSPVIDTNHSNCSKRSSLPDIPLTPREKEILQHTSEMGIYDNTPFSFPTSRSSDSITSNHRTIPQKEPSPPPKPPLLVDSTTVHRLVQQKSQEYSEDEPPPIPEKENRSSLTSTLEFLASTPKTGHMTSSSSQSPHSSFLISSSLSELSSSLGLLDRSQSPHSISPMSRSPTSSIGSGLNRSSEDLLNSSSQRSSRTNSFSRTSSDTRIENCVNTRHIINKSSSQSECTIEQIKQVTQGLNRLTTDIASMTHQPIPTEMMTVDGQPPPLPTKRLNRLPSHYDNFPEGSEQLSSILMSGARSVSSYEAKSSEARMSSSSTSSSQSLSGFQLQKSNTISFSHRTSSQDTYSSSETFSSASHSSLESLQRPPPLPPKNKHIHAYMQTFGSYTQPSTINEAVYSRHSINFYEAQWHQHQMELHQPLYPRSNTISVISDISTDSSFSGSSPSSPAIPPLPVKRKLDISNRASQISNTSSLSDTSMEYPREKAFSLVEGSPLAIAAELEPKRSSAPPGQVKDKLCLTETKPDIPKDADSDFAELNPLDDVDVSDQLVRKKETEDGPDIRGGLVDALVVHATAAGKLEFMYQEAFLTTYRTFITPKHLIEKVLYRFYKFQYASDKRKKLAKNAFSLLIRIVDELSAHELDDDIIKRLMDLVFELLCQGDLMLAKVLRKKNIEKCESKKQPEIQQTMTIMSTISLMANPSDLLHFKSHDIAEQMTLLDAELFQKIEIPEILLWAKEQSEELSPNLTQFTEHFNKMSFWCRTQILIQEEAREREKYFIKFIKIMRHLRKLSNFNSYLAILSAVDSAPIRRLEWQRPNLEALKEFCQLIDSSASFRAYRLALAETDPPCIPYIGLILQDLTFVNIGNQDNLPDGTINFAKRWQQFNILDSMRRFKNCHYELKKQDKILAVFNKFDDHLTEESLWQISEKIKPRPGKKKQMEQAET